MAFQATQERGLSRAAILAGYGGSPEVARDIKSEHSNIQVQSYVA